MGDILAPVLRIDLFLSLFLPTFCKCRELKLQSSLILRRVASRSRTREPLFLRELPRPVISRSIRASRAHISFTILTGR